jgi:hypothetical protein
MAFQKREPDPTRVASAQTEKNHEGVRDFVFALQQLIAERAELALFDEEFNSTLVGQNGIGNREPTLLPQRRAQEEISSISSSKRSPVNRMPRDGV